MKKHIALFIMLTLSLFSAFSYSLPPNTSSDSIQSGTSSISGSQTTSLAFILPYTFYFADNVYQLSTYQKKILKEFATSYLSSSKRSKIYISGYASNNNTIGNEYKISKNRANSVYSYLKSCGIPNYSMQISYFGSSVQTHSNATSLGRSKNRRVVISYDKPYSPIKTTTIQPNSNYNVIPAK